jgi:hypothetical protein
MTPSVRVADTLQLAKREAAGWKVVAAMSPTNDRAGAFILGTRVPFDRPRSLGDFAFGYYLGTNFMEPLTPVPSIRLGFVVWK